MDYEKKYKEALEKARQLCAYPTTKPFISDLQDLFPELSESEDDRIRKELTDYIKRKFENSCSPTPSKNILGNWIAWLEKQDFNYTFEIKEGHWYKCVCDYMLNNSDVMFKYGSLYYCRRDWRLDGEIDEINVKDIGVNGYKSFFRPATNQEIKDWLEKQCEQKPCDQIEKCAKCQFVFTGYCNGTCILKNNEPKFKVGDWIIFNGFTLYIKEVVQGYYRTITIDDIPNSYDWDIDNAARLWTIKEVKNGDVLKEDSCVFIVERINPNGTARVHCCLFDDGEFDLTGSTLGFDIDSTHPATKEQRDLLFQKIKETHHKWDADKKELIEL